MKKKLLILLCVAVSIVASAQETSFGIRAGINVSNLDIDPYPTVENGHRNGYFFGGFVNWRLSDQSALLTELQYSQEGAKAEALHGDYIQMPLMFKFQVTPGVSVGAGAMPAVKTWGFEDGFSTFTFSGIAGVEYLFSDMLFVDARLHYGLTSVFDEKSANDATNVTLQFGIGIKI
ncbi:porin family protein [Algibacter pacificus]|uniref:porin family protein n=1 Tax=Algibacter pacificus TaxID=2599389 RepID=UPI0011C8AA5F|nr:porin family protein [Algibacter pacificus]